MRHSCVTFILVSYSLNEPSVETDHWLGMIPIYMVGISELSVCERVSFIRAEMQMKML